MTDQKDPNWVPPWEIMEGEGFLSGNAFEQLVNERELGKPVDFREIKSISIPGAYGGKFGITMVDDLMKDTGMSAKELIAASSVNDNVVLSEFEQRVVDNNIALVDKMLELKEEDIASCLKFGEVTWNPEIKGLECISGPSVLPTCIPYNSVKRAISAINEKDTMPTVTLPLSEKMKALLSNQANAIVLVDFSSDPLEGKEFLQQFVGLPCVADIIFTHNLSYQQYEDLVLAYMTSESVYRIPILVTAVAEIVLVHRGNRYDQSPYSLPFSEEFVQQFLARNGSLVDRWLTFCDSLLLFGIYALKPLNKHYRPEEHFPTINDSFYIGSNVVQLLMLPEFTTQYFAIENVERNFYYFKQQFETDCFDGGSLLPYFRSKNNYLCAGLEGIAQGHFKPSDVGFGIFNKGVFAPDYPIVEFYFKK